jgi:uncharacterized protein
MKKETAFWDASALVPLCLHQSVTPEAVSHLKRLPPVVWWGSVVEIRSAICRLHRERAVTDAGKLAAMGRLEVLARVCREIAPGDKLRELALELLNRYPLRAADSLQLAASLIWCDERPSRRHFVCADHKLSITARTVGFGVIELP